MQSVERFPGITVGERVSFWASHPLDDEQHWQEGIVSRILRITRDDVLLEIESFGPRPYYRWISDVMKGSIHES
jgi:hypothetical protein